MKPVVVFSLIGAFMFIAYVLTTWLQTIIRPRASFSRLLLYFVVVLISVFLLSFLMVLVIGKLYPDELMK